MILLVVIFYFSQVRADELQDISDQYVLSAQTNRDLSQKLNTISKLKKLKLSCEFELKYKKVPQSCKIYLDMAKKLAFYSPDEQKKKEETLDRGCSDIVKDTSTELSDQMNLGGKCQALIDQKLKEKNYILEEKAPQNIIF